LFDSAFETELADVIPVIKTSIGGTRIVGRLCVGKVFSHSFLNLNDYNSLSWITDQFRLTFQ